MSKASRDTTILAKFEFEEFREKITVLSSKKDKKTRVYGYSLGDKIKGKVILDVLQAQPIDYMKLQVMGILWHKKKPVDPELTSVIIINTDHRRAVKCFWHEEYLLEATKIVDYQKKLGQDNPFDSLGNLKEQRHEFAFECALKTSGQAVHLVPSYEDAHVKIVYVAFVTIERPDNGKSIYLMQTLKVSSPPALENEAIQQNTSSSQTLTNSFPKVGAITAQLGIPKLRWQTNSSIPIHCLVDNATNQNVQSVEVALIREVCYTNIDRRKFYRREVVLYHKEPCIVLPGKKKVEVIFMFRLSLNTKCLYVLPHSSETLSKNGSDNLVSHGSLASSTDSLRSQFEGAAQGSGSIPGQSLTDFDSSYYTQIKVPNLLSISHQLVVSINVGSANHLEDQLKKEAAELKNKKGSKRHSSLFKAAAAAVTAVKKNASKSKEKRLNVLFSADMFFYDKTSAIKDHSISRPDKESRAHAEVDSGLADSFNRSDRSDAVANGASDYNASQLAPALPPPAYTFSNAQPAGSIRASQHARAVSPQFEDGFITKDMSQSRTPQNGSPNLAPIKQSMSNGQNRGGSASGTVRQVLKIPAKFAVTDEEFSLDSIQLDKGRCIEAEVVDERVITTPAYGL